MAESMTYSAEQTHGLRGVMCSDEIAVGHAYLVLSARSVNRRGWLLSPWPKRHSREAFESDHRQPCCVPDSPDRSAAFSQAARCVHCLSKVPHRAQSPERLPQTCNDCGCASFHALLSPAGPGLARGQQ
eukprot:6211968-Pleurochrysis_carterae.AAC.2